MKCGNNIGGGILAKLVAPIWLNNNENGAIIPLAALFENKRGVMAISGGVKTMKRNVNNRGVIVAWRHGGCSVSKLADKLISQRGENGSVYNGNNGGYLQLGRKRL
jgi:hypothetical protein